MEHEYNKMILILLFVSCLRTIVIHTHNCIRIYRSIYSQHSQQPLINSLTSSRIALRGEIRKGSFPSQVNAITLDYLLFLNNSFFTFP